MGIEIGAAGRCHGRPGIRLGATIRWVWSVCDGGGTGDNFLQHSCFWCWKHRMITCASTVKTSCPFAPFGWLIFISPSVPIGASDGAVALVPIPALSDPLPPNLPDIHHADHPDHILGHGVSTFLV